MPVVVKTALVNHSAKEMFSLVLDVNSYPEFLIWCANAESEFPEKNIQVASLGVDYLGIKQQFTTHNSFIENEQLSMRLQKGPFKQLIGKWHFKYLNDTACKLSFSLDFEFNNFLLKKVADPIFIQISNTMLDAFINRAKKIYG